jgi:hypothetical protein
MGKAITPDGLLVIATVSAKWRLKIRAGKFTAFGQPTGSRTEMAKSNDFSIESALWKTSRGSG